MKRSAEGAERLLRAWSRSPSEAAAKALRRFYGRNVASLPLSVRARLCVALGEAAEAEERHSVARYLYGAAVAAVDPGRDERAYAGAALRALWNAWKTGDRVTLAGVARLAGRLPERETTPRLVLIGAFARGLERLLRGKVEAARRCFEEAMGAAWEAGEVGGETLAHHLLSQVWALLGSVARAREHAGAARSAAVRAGSWFLRLRMELEDLMWGLAAGPSGEGLAAARRYLVEVRRRGFRRLEGRVWLGLARALRGEGAVARLFEARAGRLIPRGAEAVPAGVGTGPGGSRGLARKDPGWGRELGRLIRLARGSP